MFCNWCSESHGTVQLHSSAFHSGGSWTSILNNKKHFSTRIKTAHSVVKHSFWYVQLKWLLEHYCLLFKTAHIRHNAFISTKLIFIRATSYDHNVMSFHTCMHVHTWTHTCTCKLQKHHTNHTTCHHSNTWANKTGQVGDESLGTIQVVHRSKLMVDWVLTLVNKVQESAQTCFGLTIVTSLRNLTDL